MKKWILILPLVLASLIVLAENESKPENRQVAAKVVSGTEIQTIALTGKVTDLNTGEALTGVKVTIEGLDVKAYTDFDGNFKFENLSQGQYNINASFISYSKNQIRKFNASKNTGHLEIKLQSTP